MQLTIIPLWLKSPLLPFFVQFQLREKKTKRKNPVPSGEVIISVRHHPLETTLYLSTYLLFVSGYKQQQQQCILVQSCASLVEGVFPRNKRQKLLEASQSKKIA